MKRNASEAGCAVPLKAPRALLIPQHSRDLIQMVSAMKSVEGPSRSQYIVFSFGTEFSRQMPRDFPHELEDDDIVFLFSQKLVAHRKIDGQALAEFREHARKLALRFGPFSKVVVSNPFGISAEFVRYFRNCDNPEIVVVPEGLGVLTERRQASPWEYVGWLKAVRSVGGHLWDSACRRHVNGPLQPGEVIWSLKRIAKLLLYRPLKPAPETVRAVDLLVSMALPPDVILPFQAKMTRTVGVTGNSELVPNLGIFLHQPHLIDGDTGRRIFQKIRANGVTQLVLKRHRSDRGWETLVEAAQSVFGPERLEIPEEQTLAEELIGRRGISVICGVSSTALLNAAYLFPDARVLAFTATVRSGAGYTAEAFVDLDVLEKALRQYGENRIEFV